MSKSITKITTLILTTLLTVEFSSLAQIDSLFEISRVEDIVLDGLSNEPAWERIKPVPMVQYEPNFNDPPTERTEIRFGYDDEYFYSSLRAYDSDPDGIRGNSLYRDRLAGSDHFEILLDTYNDNETAMIFSTTPTGVRNDVAITNDATGGSIRSGGWLNRDFNTFWDAEVVVNENGWFAEIRIPFSSLRFQPKDGEVIMGLSVQRMIARKRERTVFPAIPPIADWAFLRPSQAQKIVLKGVESNKKVYVTPYGLGGYRQWSQINETQNQYEKKNDFTLQTGGDIKFSLSNNMTVDFTVNTDFAQVEADDQQVNLTRFSLFYPEKRQFFMERAGIFDYRTGQLSRLFHSRSIGLTRDGQPVRIYGGIRTVSRTGTWDIGLLNMQTAPLDTIPSNNFGVVRLRRRILNKYSYLGGMITSKVGLDGSRNFAYGVDGVVRISGYDYITLQTAQTLDEDPATDKLNGGLASSRITLELQRRKREGFGYDLGTIWSGPDYNPGIGFVRRNDFTFGTGSFSYTWLYQDTSRLFIWQTIQMTGYSYLRNKESTLESVLVGPEWLWTSRSTASGKVELKYQFENLITDFNLSEDSNVPAGEYGFYYIGASYNMPFQTLIQCDVSFQAGTFYDGKRVNLVLTPSWYVSKHLELSAEYEYDRIRFSNRNQQFDSHISRIRIGTAVNNQLSTNAFIQYNSTISLFSANVRFRYNFREGNDLWIVYNEGLNTNRYNAVPEPPMSDSRSVMIKYTNTFQF